MPKTSIQSLRRGERRAVEQVDPDVLVELQH